MTMPHEFPSRMNYSFVRMYFNEWLLSDDVVLYLTYCLGILISNSNFLESEQSKNVFVAGDFL